MINVNTLYLWRWGERSQASVWQTYLANCYQLPRTETSDSRLCGKFGGCCLHHRNSSRRIPTSYPSQAGRVQHGIYPGTGTLMCAVGGRVTLKQWLTLVLLYHKEYFRENSPISPESRDHKLTKYRSIAAAWIVYYSSTSIVRLLIGTFVSFFFV